MLLRRISTISFLVVLSVLPLMADKEDSNIQSSNSLVPDVPKFSITYQGEDLVCSLAELTICRILCNVNKYIYLQVSNLNTFYRKKGT